MTPLVASSLPSARGMSAGTVASAGSDFMEMSYGSGQSNHGVYSLDDVSLGVAIPAKSITPVFGHGSDVKRLASSQSVDGFFELDMSLVGILKTNVADLRKQAVAAGAGSRPAIELERIGFTIAVIVKLHRDDESLWQRQIKKALAWLESVGIKIQLKIAGARTLSL